MITVKNKTYTVEEFITFCKESESYRELGIKLGYSGNLGGSTTQKLKNLIK
jgi:hypothetical protein